jgi:hypothetical protein
MRLGHTTHEGGVGCGPGAATEHWSREAYLPEASWRTVAALVPDPRRPQGQSLAFGSWAKTKVLIEFFIFFKLFCKIIRSFEILADLATNHRAPRRLGTNCHSARRLEAGDDVLRRPTTVGPNRRGPRRLV